MLSADHYALEHRAVQQLLELRQKEVSYLTDRFNAVGTQSSLIAGFVVSVLTSVTVSDPGVSVYTRWAFWISSACSLACSFHCLLASTFASVYGPGLALRGPEGSVTRAFYNLRHDQKHTMAMFTGSLFFFVLQVVATFFALDDVPEVTAPAVLCTFIVVSVCTGSVFIVLDMKKRFSYKGGGVDETIEAALGKDDEDFVRHSDSPPRAPPPPLPGLRQG